MIMMVKWWNNKKLLEPTNLLHLFNYQTSRKYSTQLHQYIFLIYHQLNCNFPLNSIHYFIHTGYFLFSFRIQIYIYFSSRLTCNVFFHSIDEAMFLRIVSITSPRLIVICVLCTKVGGVTSCGKTRELVYQGFVIKRYLHLLVYR